MPAGLHIATLFASAPVDVPTNDGSRPILHYANMAKPKLHYLKEWRQYAGVTQEALAAWAGTDKSVISLIENGHRGLSDEWAHKFAPILRTRPGLLYENPYLLDTELLKAVQEVPTENREQALAILETFRKRA
jgi:DNA-binding XRE family transcriptional regulator